MTRVSVSCRKLSPKFILIFHPLIFLHDKDLEEDGTEPNRLKSDEERKYGKIPTKIYLLYLKSCGLRTIGIFCISALAWQVMKIYLDVWLRDWTDIEQTNRFADVCV